MSEENVASNLLGRDVETVDENLEPTDSDADVESGESEIQVEAEDQVEVETQVQAEGEEFVPEEPQAEDSSQETPQDAELTQAEAAQEDLPQDAETLDSSETVNETSAETEEILDTAETVDTDLAETPEAVELAESDESAVDATDPEVIDTAESEVRDAPESEAAATAEIEVADAAETEISDSAPAEGSDAAELDGVDVVEPEGADTVIADADTTESVVDAVEEEAEAGDSAPDDFEPPVIAPIADEAEPEVGTDAQAETDTEASHVPSGSASVPKKGLKSPRSPRPPKPVKGHATGSPAKPRKKHPILAAGIAAFGAVLLVGGAVGGGAWFFQDHAKPGFHLMGEPVTGLSATEVATLAADLSSEYSVTFQMGNVLTSATPSDAGITINTDSTVDSVMEPRSNTGLLSLYNPFVPKDVPLSLSVNKAKLQAYLDETFITADKRQVPAGVTFDEGTGLFTVVPAIDGIQADATAVAQQLESGIGLNDPIEVPTVVEPPFITNETIQKAVDAANTRLTAGYTFTANGLTYTVPPSAVRGWIDVVIDKAAGTATLTYNEEALKQALPALLNQNLADNAKDTQVMVGPEGQHLAVVQYGVDGTAVANMDSIVKAAYDALTAGTPLNLPVAVEPQAATEVPVPMDPEYTVANGEKWIELNLSAFTATRWEGTTKLNTYIVALGRLDTPTRPGIFHVWMKLASQDMYGVDDGVPWRYDGVPWISYFDGARAFHGVYWHVAFGTRASHGCAGMWINEAKELWEWDEVGTMVVVHY